MVEEVGGRNTISLDSVGSIFFPSAIFNQRKFSKVNENTYGFADLGDVSEKLNLELHQQLKNDPLILSFEQEQTIARELRAENREIYIEDPAYIQGYQDWYLNRMNVPGAWERCFTGKGVTVAIVDRGVNGRHPDLEENYDGSIDIDIQEGLDNANPSADSVVHGTNSAGVIAASRNEFCGIGIAFDAKITGIKLFGSKSLTDSMEAQALSHRLDKIDIYSNSWGPPGTGTTVSPLGILTQEAGRGGKGAIYVFAAGNGGIYQDSCAYDGYVNDIGTIAVTAVNKNGQMLQSSERCSAILVSAYSRSKLDRDPIVTTTDTGTKCTGKFGKTSAAAPQVSAIIALALQANPDLTWRDVQHLLVRTSEHNSKLRYFEEQTIVNGAGFEVSPAFGFGLVQATKMVDLASKWKNVSPMKTCEIVFKKGVSSEVPDEFTKYVSEEDCNSVRYLEHVEAIVDLNYCVRGYVRVIVTSPFGTKSAVMPGRVEDSRSSILKWTADTVQFWGERPQGAWKVSIEPLFGGKVTCRGTGVLYNLSLRIYGSYERPEEYNFAARHNYCPIKRGNWESFGATMGPLLPGKHPSEESNKYIQLQNAFYDLDNFRQRIVFEMKSRQKKLEMTETSTDVSQFSTASTHNAGNQNGCFETPIEGSILQAGRGSTKSQLGISNIETCKAVCLEDSRCKSITYISNYRQRNRQGVWEDFGDRLFLILLTPVSVIELNIDLAAFVIIDSGDSKRDAAEYDVP
ncbi:Proprotein convertase subtilisin/kexin type 4 [Nymphon striatum]|nr:Proprotein convertase subtilisin/kexin type 4 [Nymphon striatum]